jgi:hypothetical protein
MEGEEGVSVRNSSGKIRSGIQGCYDRSFGRVPQEAKKAPKAQKEFSGEYQWTRPQSLSWVSQDRHRGDDTSSWTPNISAMAILGDPR